MEFLDIGEGISLRIDHITAVKKFRTELSITGTTVTTRITFYTGNSREWVISDPKAIEFIEEFLNIRTFQRRI